MNKIYLISVLVLLQLLGVASSVSEKHRWVNAEYRNKIYPKKDFFVEFAKQTGVKFRNRKDAEAKLIKQTKDRLIQRIYSNVTSSSEFVVKESSSNGYNAEYNSVVKIFSDVELFDSETKISYDRSNKTLYVLIAINKKNLGEKYLQSLYNKLLVLYNQLQSYNVEENNAKTLDIDIKNYESRLYALKKQVQIIIAIGETIPEKYNDMFAEVSSEIGYLKKVLMVNKNDELIEEAQELLFNKRYVEALSAFKIAKMNLPDNERIIFGIKESKEKIEIQFLNKANNFENKQQYDMALLVYEKLFNILPELKSKYEKKYNKLIKLSFDIFADKLDFALKNGSISDIVEALNNLQKYQQVDRNRYNKYHIKVNKAIANDLYDQAKIEYNDERYYSSINIINRAIEIDPDNSSYTDLKKRSQHKIFKLELNKLKKTRPFLYAVQWGGAIQTQNNLLSTYLQTDKWEFKMLPSVSVGLYRKYRIIEDVWSSGRDKSWSSMVGVKYTHLFQQVYYSTDNKIVKTDMIGLNEFEAVLGLGPKYLFNIGVTAYNITPEFMKNKIDMMSVSLTNRIYMHPFELQLELKTYIDNSMNFYPLVKLYLLINSNLIRKINKNDKSKIKYYIKN